MNKQKREEISKEEPAKTGKNGSEHNFGEGRRKEGHRAMYPCVREEMDISMTKKQEE